MHQVGTCSCVKLVHVHVSGWYTRTVLLPSFLLSFFIIIYKGNMSNNGARYLFCFPLDVTGNIKTLSGIKCFHLIWLKCCYVHSFLNIIVTKKDRERTQFPRSSYMRGLEDLEQAKLITVDRMQGRSCRITVNTDLLDQKSKEFILKGKKLSA